MNYNEALSYINDKDKFGSRLGLDSIGRLLENLGNPQDDLKFIHIAGTNGKGSTSAFLSSCIQEAGYSVGLFTSPFLERFNERIKLNGKDIPDEAIGMLTKKIELAANKMVEEGMDHPTTFEIVTALAFLYYKQERPDYVVLEVGLGGRFDSTNIIKDALASVITTIDFDHINELGDTLAKIAYQKAGIIKRDGLVISYPQEEEVVEVLKDVTKDMNAELIFSTLDIEIIEETDNGSEFNYEYGSNKFEGLKTSMIGEYQVYNASLAITTILALRERGLIDIENSEIYKGILNTRWNGRIEVLKRDPIFLIDGAHNLQGMENLSEALELFDYRKLILGISILKDKDIDNMLKTIVPLADTVIATEANIPRKLPATELKEKIKGYAREVIIEKDIKNAVLKAIEIADKDDMIVFGGSLYLIGEVRTIVNLL
ncbi:bifunctional folylpolyglutamate synthase/dihydrofolate synthase [Tissierella creatinophila]|uniref:tetrahydrofolate synthase n=1 Tax=Tissierella creatinophila DSM 6911 TaxID=1123403 RepID=A0A1U7M561_TISCR|nr:folylpolyglutamate synthase/dihydrofolate synthase family protein [Tissierella creatinophila]OLS02447.1 folylpolyglutamate synthase [Tissierella creatinophila DSM 6911]